MKAKILLRIASVVMLFHALGHMLGHSTWKESTGNLVREEVVKQMTENKFPFMGVNRSLGEFFDGFGHASTIALLFIVAVLWILSNTGKENPLSGKLLWASALFLFFMGIDELVFFFPFAASFSLLSALLTIVAAFQLRKQ